MKTNEPILVDLKCRFCRFKWTAFMPDGINSDDYECPRCGRRTLYPEGPIKDIKPNELS